MTLSAEPTTARSVAATRGSVREVADLAYPVVLTQISITFTQVVDSMMVGRLGATELASVGFGGIWMWTAMCLFIGTTTAVQTFVSQHHGAGEAERCGDWCWQGVYAVAPMALGASLLLFGISPWLMHWLGPSQEMQPLATSYVQARAFGTVGLTVATAFGAFFRGIGDTRTPLVTVLIANALNVLLDYGLIFGKLGLPAWGVFGAGVATAVAEWVYAGALFVFFSRRRVRETYRTQRSAPSRKELRRLLRTGLPIGGQWALEMTSFAAFSTLVARMGDASMAASQAFIMLLAFSFMQAIGLSIAVATLVGRYVGAKDPDAAARSFDSAIWLGLGLAGVLAVLYLAIPQTLLGLFTDDPSVLRLGRPLLLVGAAFQVFDAVAIVTDGALRGAGDTRWPFVVRFLLAWGLFVPLGWGLGIGLGFGLTGAWAGGVIYIAVVAAVLYWRFRSGAWRRVEI